MYFKMLHVIDYFFVTCISLIIGVYDFRKAAGGHLVRVIEIETTLTVPHQIN